MKPFGNLTFSYRIPGVKVCSVMRFSSARKVILRRYVELETVNLKQREPDISCRAPADQMLFRRYMAEILPIRRKTQSKLSINQIILNRMSDMTIQLDNFKEKLLGTTSSVSSEVKKLKNDEKTQ